MKKIITAILATVFVAGIAMSTAHATNSLPSAKERAEAFKKMVDGMKKRAATRCKQCQKPNPNAKNDALTTEQFEELFGKNR
jgi:hypothetical protein